MISDYMSKTIVGEILILFQDLIRNIRKKHHRIGQKECVGQIIKGLKGIESNDSKIMTRPGNDPITNRGNKYLRNGRLECIQRSE